MQNQKRQGSKLVVPSPTSTEFVERTWDFDPNGERGDLARLIPLNDHARSIFQQMAAKFDGETHWEPTARRFIDYEEVNNDQYVGCYRFNLEILPPEFEKRGWCIGSGIPGQPEKTPILLTPEFCTRGVDHRHCIIKFKENGGPPILLARGNVIINGLDELRKGESRVLDERTGICIGDLLYRFEFTSFSKTRAYERQVRGLKFLRHDRTTSPSPAPLVLGKWRAYTRGFGGATSLVLPGYNCETREMVAIKRIKRSKGNEAGIAAEIVLLRKLQHPNTTRLLEVLGEDGHLSGNSFDEINLILTPYTFSFTEHREATIIQLKTFWRDCHAGLAYLHSESIMHRDIKRQNIGIRLDPLQAVLQDFGSAKECLTCTDHRAGTVPYLAPEVLALKVSEGSKGDQVPYTHAVDVWGLGIAFSEALLGTVEWVPHGVRYSAYYTRYTKHERIETQNDGDLSRQICDAIQWEASSRPFAATLQQTADASLRQVKHKRRQPTS